MIRSKYIIHAYEKHNILDNVTARGSQIVERLSQIPTISGLRSKGLIIGFDLKDTEARNRFMKRLYDKGMICNSTGQRSIRLRPNLALSSEDAAHGCQLIEESLNEV
jgi:4-aminobutyrate aminotransferase-like enzyme